MKNIFYKMFSRSIISDFIMLLTVDINTKVNVKEKSRDEIHSNFGNYFGTVGMQRKINLFKRFIFAGKFDGLVYGHKINLSKQISSLDVGDINK